MNSIVTKIDFFTRIIIVTVICNITPIASKSPRIQKLLEKREKVIKQIEMKHSEKQANTKNVNSTKNSNLATLDKELPITLFIYAHNASEWITFNLDSVLNQNYENYRIIYVDDASNDNTSEKVKKYLKSKNTKVKIDVLTYPKPQGKLKLMYSILYNCLDEEIIILLDARDWLAHDAVLRNLCLEYTYNNTWVTFGRCTSEPKSCNIGLRNGDIPQDILENQQFRKIFPFMPTHSFYAGLFKQIKKDDLIDAQTNDFYTHAAECHIMWPLIEMANTHFKAINEITYVVNCTDPIAKLIEDYHLRMACNQQIGKKLPVYQAISTPF